jgi:hypothetical protein
MTEVQIKIDALLATSCSRLLQAAASANQMRHAVAANNGDYAAQASYTLAEHMNVVEESLLEAARLVRMHNAANLAAAGLAMQSDGGRIH